jgi:hypothetical protein
MNWTKKATNNGAVDVPVDSPRDLGLIPMVIE